jgi:ferredoxin
VKAEADAVKCMAAGYCQQVAPQVFELDEAIGHVVVKVDEIAAEDEDDAREAESLCPMVAITIST